MNLVSANISFSCGYLRSNHAGIICRSDNTNINEENFIIQHENNSEMYYAIGMIDSLRGFVCGSGTSPTSPSYG